MDFVYYPTPRILKIGIPHIIDDFRDVAINSTNIDDFHS